MTLQERQLLFTEIEILCCIRHPNVLNAYDYIDYSDTCYIITEYIPGGDLYTFLENRDYKLTESYTVNIVQQICCALFYLNTLGILHRDIKPEHILLNENYEKPIAKLIDFGLSDFIFPNELKNETYGTIGYIAPEILEEKFRKEIDERFKKNEEIQEMFEKKEKERKAEEEKERKRRMEEEKRRREEENKRWEDLIKKVRKEEAERIRNEEREKIRNEENERIRIEKQIY